MPSSVLRSIGRALWRVVRGVLLAVAVVVLYVEEWGWRPLAAVLARLGRWPPLQRLEDRVRRVSPRWALSLFLVPAVLLFPIKLLALWLIHQGRAALGIAVIVAAKLFGTAMVGRLFVLTEAQLMSFGWFARALGWWNDTKRRVRAAVQASAMARGMRREAACAALAAAPVAAAGAVIGAVRRTTVVAVSIAGSRGATTAASVG